MSTGSYNFSPPNLIRHGYDWSGQTARLPYIFVTLALVLLASLIPVTRNFSGSNTAVFVGLTMVFPIWLGHTRRRLRDVGWSGWCMWLAILPITGLLLTIILAFKPSSDPDIEADQGYSRVGFAVALVFGCLMLSRAFWAPYWIPAASMKPTLLIGDFIAAVPISQPKRGDILIYRHPVKDAEWIQRLIGLPGDTLQMIDGVLYLNDAALSQTQTGTFSELYAPQGPTLYRPRCANADAGQTLFCEKPRTRETLPSGRSYDILDIGTYPADNSGVFTVPDGHYFFLGDNRDNALDSRFDQDMGGVGFVPRENLTGRAARVVFSSAGTSMMHVWTWRTDRFFTRLQ